MCQQKPGGLSNTVPAFNSQWLSVKLFIACCAKARSFNCEYISFLRHYQNCYLKEILFLNNLLQNQSGLRAYSE